MCNRCYGKGKEKKIKKKEKNKARLANLGRVKEGSLEEMTPKLVLEAEEISNKEEECSGWSE